MVKSNQFVRLCAHVKPICCVSAVSTMKNLLWRSCKGAQAIIMHYSCGNVQNKPNGRFYGDALNQMYILSIVLSNTTTNISTSINFEKNMVDFSIIWLCKLFCQANFGLGFKEIGIDFEQALWLSNWHQKMARDTER